MLILSLLFAAALAAPRDLLEDKIKADVISGSLRKDGSSNKGGILKQCLPEWTMCKKGFSLFGGVK